MSDFDHRCGQCGAITMCAVHAGYASDCPAHQRKDCHEVCTKDNRHDVYQDEII